MRKIINGKIYDTEKAECLGSYDNGNCRNHFSFYEAELYKTKKGNYFIYENGGPNSKCSIYVGGNYMGGSNIYSVSKEEASQWAEKHLEIDDYIRIFGDIEEA